MFTIASIYKGFKKSKIYLSIPLDRENNANYISFIYFWGLFFDIYYSGGKENISVSIDLNFTRFFWLFEHF